LNLRVELRQFCGNNPFHLVAKLAVISSIENKIDHESTPAAARSPVL
jgi:hypothetical protein